MADGENMADLFVPTKSLKLVTPCDSGLHIHRPRLPVDRLSHIGENGEDNRSTLRQLTSSLPTERERPHQMQDCCVGMTMVTDQNI